jgi:hypothetical protein
MCESVVGEGHSECDWPLLHDWLSGEEWKAGVITRLVFSQVWCMLQEKQCQDCGLEEWHIWPLYVGWPSCNSMVGSNLWTSWIVEVCFEYECSREQGRSYISFYVLFSVLICPYMSHCIGWNNHRSHPHSRGKGHSSYISKTGMSKMKLQRLGGQQILSHIPDKNTKDISSPTFSFFFFSFFFYYS